MALEARLCAGSGSEGVTGMSEDLPERMIDAIFALLDAGADGAITFEDLAALGIRVCEQLRIAGSAQAEAILDGYASWWEQLRADCDADGDERVSRAEFARALTCGGDGQASYDHRMGRLISLFADALDADRDGFIEPTEYLALFGAAPGLDPQIVEAAFEGLDTDGDGRISREEFQAGVTRAFLSGDENLPGTRIPGQP
jgi:Ca2+-binding EF-hand superfamily protein